MPIYEYRGVTAAGRNSRGQREAENVEALKASLKREGVTPLEVRETQAKGGPAGAAGGPKGSGGEGGGGSREIHFRAFTQRAKAPDVTLATRQLATLTRAGIPLVESLTAVIEQTPKVDLKNALVDVRDRVNEGTALAEALKRHAKLFPDYFVNMVNAGEQSGTLEAVLDRLADFAEMQGKLRSKVIAALTYPLIMACLGMIVVGILMVVVVPQVTTIFRDFGKDLPWYTDLLINISGFVGRWWWLIIAAVVGAVLAFRAWKRSPGGRRRWDRFVLRLPIAGNLARRVAVARFARTLSTLLRSGVPVLKAMDITKSVMGNTQLEAIVEEARAAVQEGESIAVPLKRSGRFDPIVTHMIAVGERSGQLEEMLMSVAASYESQVETQLTTLTALLEPIMIVVMGGAAASIAAAILLPLMRLSEFIQ